MQSVRLNIYSRLKLKFLYYVRNISRKDIILYCVLIFFGFFSLYFMININQTNSLFDKNIQKLANPLLKEVMQKDYHRIHKNTLCSFEPTQFHLDIDEMLVELLKKKYDLYITCLTINQYPGTPMRMNGIEEVDSIFHNTDAIKCDTERRYQALKKRYKYKIQMMQMNKNTQLYNFYEQEDGRNHHIFLENIARYPNQLFGIKVDFNDFPVNTGKYWIIRYKNYYYLFLETNGLQGQNQDITQERHLIYKKLTLNELMKYDNGRYWEIIKKYNIKI